MNHNVRETIRRYRMLEYGDSVVIGISGGADSVTLLHLLCTLREEYALSLRACHVNHGLRGEESLRDQRFVENFCASLEVPLDVLEADVGRMAKERRVSEEECGRQIRYEFFERCCEAGGRIATAHTLDDSLETVLFNLSRGTGLAGLCGIQPMRENIIRPLIGCTRAEIEEYCARNGLSYVTDSTNLCTDYSRNRIRLTVVPQLERLGGNLRQNAGRMTELLRQDEDYLQRQTRNFLKRHQTGRGIEIAALRDEHPAIASRAVRMLLIESGFPYDRQHIEMALRMASEGHGTLQVSADCYLEVKDGCLRAWKKERAVNYFEKPLNFGKTVLQDGIAVHIKLVEVPHRENLKNIHTNMLRSCLDYDKIIGKVVVRQRLDGDKIRLWDRKMTKSLKKLFQEKKLSASERAERILLADEQGVIWLEGFGCDERAAPDEGTSRLLVIERCEKRTS
ncbi:tRNA lysidine(34) synthetase TilS [Candidatus Soleaferrea massiliensis]|uniref:tRNA lysidine(34) synthetase TilS n=1 Tax=Candidatus Soleaferrea massiliensis TaxID=1470354 RepID=UPI000694E70B|nr:tRNA lysidine(34) synthetase TilS [Candidatus Soleaferrea massiliensis]